MEKETKMRVLGMVLVLSFSLVFLVIGIVRWASVGFFIDQGDLSYIGYVTLGTLGYLTTVHLWSRVSSFEKGTSIRTLFLLMGLSFLIISVIFIFYIVDSLWGWFMGQNITVMINSLTPGGVKFDLFLVADLHISMQAIDVVVFSMMVAGISFYIFPLERYVKSRKPWFTISLWIIVGFMPVLVIFKDFDLVLSVATAVIVLFVLVNFVFMFYLYITLARMSTGKMRSASILVATGLILMIGVWIVGWAYTGDQLTSAILQFATGILSLTLFNAGFWRMH